MGETGPIPLRIREARVPIVNDNECVRKINTVTKKIFDDEDTPDELIIPKQDERCSDKGDKKEKESKDEDEEIMEAAETTTAVQVVKTKEKPKKEKPVNNPTFDIPLEKRCRGTCVTGFFSLLCDEIDRNAICPGSGRCCITKAPTRRRPPTGTTSSPIRKTTTRAPRPPRPAPNRQKLLKCPGVCLPSTMKSLCSQPSIIVPVPTTCKKGTFCCDHKDPSHERTPPPPPRGRPLPPRRDVIPGGRRAMMRVRETEEGL